jgi:phage-related tail fiber protein
MISTSADKIDEAFAAGKLPTHLDVAMDGCNAKNEQSPLHSPTKVRKRDSTWGQHAGLYDGSGYGTGSSLRPVTGVTETSDVPCACIPGAFSDDENEAPTIIRRLWNNTYPHGLDTNFPGQVTVVDAAIPEAQEQSESHIKDYEAFQGMLHPRGNA